jgi:hypothetical protein
MSILLSEVVEIKQDDGILSQLRFDTKYDVNTGVKFFGHVEPVATNVLFYCTDDLCAPIDYTEPGWGDKLLEFAAQEADRQRAKQLPLGCQCTQNKFSLSPCSVRTTTGHTRCHKHKKRCPPNLLKAACLGRTRGKGGLNVQGLRRLCTGCGALTREKLLDRLCTQPVDSQKRLL